jgi:hypothetical protein
MSRCPRCWHRIRPLTFSDGDYAELLGLYLGDGHISELPRTQRLRLFLDARYRTIVEETDALLRRCFSENPDGRVVFQGDSAQPPRGRRPTPRACGRQVLSANRYSWRPGGCGGMADARRSGRRELRLVEVRILSAALGPVATLATGPRRYRLGD